MQVFLKLIHGTTVRSPVVLLLQEGCTVSELYEQVIYQTNDVVPELSHFDWRLTYAGQELNQEDCSFLEDYDVMDMATLEMTARMNGGSDERILFMANQPLKTIGQVPNCPSMRGCPKCGTLLEHTAACKHMKCWSCSCEFCFVCLLQKLPPDQWQCGLHSSIRPVAPVQTVLPNAN